ncbi:Bacillibactin exporter [compost metagenome]
MYAIFAIGCICMFVVFGVLFYLSEMLEEKYSVVGIVKGCILAIPLGALCLSSYIAGRAIGKNKKRMKWTTFIGLSLLTLAVGFCAIIQSIYLLVGMLCLAGIGIGAALPCLDALITEGIEKEQRGTITSIYSSMRFIGVAVGPPAASLLLNRSSQMMFYTIAATCLAAAILSLTAIRPKQSASGEKAA